MADYTIKRIDDMESIAGGAMKRARGELGVESFGIQVLDIPPNIDEQYPEHDHADDGQEEVYMVLHGAAEIEIAGDRHPLEPGTMVRVGPGVMRRIRTGSEAARVLALGGRAGKAYDAPDFSKLGSPDPTVQQTA
jgi:mannose-6-phosphate isomerase-like protein (cupin superfamily)